MVGGPEVTLVPSARARSGNEPPGVGEASCASLVLENIGVRFGGISALQGVELVVEQGAVWGLIGPNGAGKTTLFDVISGLRSPNEGRVWLGGVDATRSSAVTRARRGLRRTFQRVQTFGWLSVEDNVLAALEWRGGGGGMFADITRFPTRRSRERERRARVEVVLESCGLTAVRSDPVGSLPIGLARMVEFARAIVDEPSLLLLDEPTSGLDQRESERLIGQLQLLREASQCAVVLVEHDMGFVMDQCDQIAVLELGRVIATGAPQQIQADPVVRAAYLGEGSKRSQHRTIHSEGGQS